MYIHTCNPHEITEKKDKTSHMDGHGHGTSSCWASPSIPSSLQPLRSPGIQRWVVGRTYSLVGGFNPLKNMKVSWDDYSQYMEKQKNVPNHQPAVAIQP